MATGNVSLLDTAKNMAPSREKAAILTYATTSHVLAHLPLEAQPTGVKKWKLVNDIAYTTSAAAYRNIGSEYTATKTPTSNFAANVKIAGGRVQLDRVLKKLSPENISIERRGQIAANARRITIDIFEGSGGSAIWGIDNWINVSTVFANQSMDMGTASTGGLITEDGLDEFLIYEAGVRVKGMHVQGEAWHSKNTGAWYFISHLNAKNYNLLPRRQNRPDSSQAALLLASKVRA